MGYFDNLIKLKKQKNENYKKPKIENPSLYSEFCKNHSDQILNADYKIDENGKVKYLGHGCGKIHQSKKPSLR